MKPSGTFWPSHVGPLVGLSHCQPFWPTSDTEGTSQRTEDMHLTLLEENMCHILHRSNYFEKALGILIELEYI